MQSFAREHDPATHPLEEVLEVLASRPCSIARTQIGSSCRPRWVGEYGPIKVFHLFGEPEPHARGPGELPEREAWAGDEGEELLGDLVRLPRLTPHLAPVAS